MRFGNGPGFRPDFIPEGEEHKYPRLVTPGRDFVPDDDIGAPKVEETPALAGLSPRLQEAIRSEIAKAEAEMGVGQDASGDTPTAGAVAGDAADAPGVAVAAAPVAIAMTRKPPGRPRKSEVRDG